MSRKTINRRQFVGTAAFAALGLPVVMRRPYELLTDAQTTTPLYTPPKSPRATLNFNHGWKFLREDAAGAEAPVGGTLLQIRSWIQWPSHHSTGFTCVPSTCIVKCR